MSVDHFTQLSINITLKHTKRQLSLTRLHYFICLDKWNIKPIFNLDSVAERRSSVVVSTSAWHVVGPGMLYFSCTNLALNIGDCISVVGRGGSVVGTPL